MFKFNEESALEEQGSSLGRILDTGVYDVTIKTISEVVAGTGTKGVDISYQVEGAKYPNVIYGLWFQKANGDDINFQKAKLNSLVGLTPNKTVTVYDKTIEVKDGNKVVKAWKELDDFPCKMVIQKIFDYYNGEVREKNEVVAFLGTDGKTYAESVKGSDAKQLKYYTEKLTNVVTEAYKKYQADGGDTTEEAEETGSLL